MNEISNEQPDSSGSGVVADPVENGEQLRVLGAGNGMAKQTISKWEQKRPKWGSACPNSAGCNQMLRKCVKLKNGATKCCENVLN